MNGHISMATGAIGALAVGASAAAGGVIGYTSQTRTGFALAGEGGNPIDTRMVSAPGFDPWAGNAQASFGYIDNSISPPKYTARGTGSASQTTTLGEDRITVTSIRALASGYGLSPTNADPLYGSAFSTFMVEFDLAADSAFSFAGTMSVFEQGVGLSGWTLELRLESSTATAYDVNFFSGGTNDGFGDFATSGVLGAGSWTLSASLTASATAVVGDPSADITSASVYAAFELVVPTPGSGAGLAFAGVFAVRRRRR